MDVLALAAGPELDAVIAVHIMNWRDVGWAAVRENSVTLTSLPGSAPRYCGYRPETPWSAGRPEPVPRYSAGEGQAVQRELERQGWAVEITAAEGPIPELMQTSVTVTLPTGRAFQVDAETRDLALCRAALAAIEHLNRRKGNPPNSLDTSFLHRLLPTSAGAAAAEPEAATVAPPGATAAGPATGGQAPGGPVAPEPEPQRLPSPAVAAAVPAAEPAVEATAVAAAAAPGIMGDTGGGSASGTVANGTGGATPTVAADAPVGTTPPPGGRAPAGFWPRLRGHLLSRRLDHRLRLLERDAATVTGAELARLFDHAGDLCVEASLRERSLGYYGQAIDAYLQARHIEAAIGLCRKVIERSPEVVRTRGTYAFLTLGRTLAFYSLDENWRQSLREIGEPIGPPQSMHEYLRSVERIGDYVHAACKSGQRNAAIRRLHLMNEATLVEEVRKLISEYLLELDDPLGASAVLRMHSAHPVDSPAVLAEKQWVAWANALRVPIVPAVAGRPSFHPVEHRA